MKKRGFNTRLLHVPYLRPDAHGAIQAPLYATSAFEFETAEDIEGSFRGTKMAHAYTRSGNPTVEHLEQRIKAITDANAVIATASGMAAITAIMLTLVKTGENVITTKRLFGNSYALFENTLRAFGIEFRYVNFTQPDQIEKQIDSNTRVVFLETINNPQLEVVDIELIANITKKHNLVLAADTTLTPPCIFDAGAAGINISVMSSTKYISSGGASVGGLVVDHGNFDWSKNPKLAPFAPQFGNLTFAARLRREAIRNMGGCMSPFNAYLQILGLETMSLRFNRMADNALKIAKWLSKQKQVKSVNYPGIESSPYNVMAKKLYSALPGGLITFDLFKREDCYTFQNKLKLIKRATNLNDNKSLIIHPESTIFAEFSKEIRDELDIRDTLLRFSIGIEDAEDIIDDLEQALNSL